jgi:hypothetical protein
VENYRYLCFKYKLCHADWYISLNHVMSKITNITECDQYVIQSIIELCEVRDGISKCDVVNNMTFINTFLHHICTD